MKKYLLAGVLAIFAWVSPLHASESNKAAPKEIKLVVPFPVGQSADQAARVIQKHLNASGKYNIVIEYKLGAGGSLAANHMASSSVAGQTTLMVQTAGMFTAPVLTPNIVTYDIKRDFQPVAYLGTQPVIMVTSSVTGIKSYRGLIDLSRKTKLSYGTGGVGSHGHFFTALTLGDNANNFIHVPYKGPATVDVVAGTVTIMTESLNTVEQLIKDGKLVSLAVGYPNRLKQFPNTPTFKELGINDYNFYRRFILLGNKSADSREVEEIRNLINNPEVVQDLIATGLAFEFNMIDRSLDSYFDNMQKMVVQIAPKIKDLK